MSSSAFPNELWMNVFELLDSPRDLASVVRASRRFQLLGERILYKCLIWTHPRSFVKNYPFLIDNSNLLTAPRSLTLGISYAYTNNDRIEQILRAKGIVHCDGSIQPISRSSRTYEVRAVDDIGIYNAIEYLASEYVTKIMYDLAVGCINLRELNFVSMVLPDTFYSFVHNFPSLNKLRIEDCTPPVNPVPTNLHPSDLPITELTILALRGRRDVREMRALAEGKHLRVIRFDWTCYIYKHFCPPIHGVGAGPAQTVWPLQMNVPGPHALDVFSQTHRGAHQILPSRPSRELSPHIHTIDVKFPTHKSWQSYGVEPHEQLINPFARFLERCPMLTCLTIRNHLPWIRLAENALPNLAHYQGPVTPIKSVMTSSRPIRRLDIRDPFGSLAGLEKAFKDIESAGAEQSLEDLSMYLARWDDEILYAILHHFRGLKTLEIRYEDGDPSEEIVLAMGPHFFGDMPNLVSVHVFKYGCEPIESVAEQLRTRGTAFVRNLLADSDTEREFESLCTGRFSSQVQSEFEVNQRELINAWNRYCPKLREVQLQAEYVWRRAGVDDVWTKRKHILG